MSPSSPVAHNAPPMLTSVMIDSMTQSKAALGDLRTVLFDFDDTLVEASMAAVSCGASFDWLP